MLTTKQLKQKKQKITKELSCIEMKIIAYADSCRDSKNVHEYSKAVTALNSLQSIGLT